MKASVHIYALSKLVHASPGDWESALKAIEQKKRLAYGYYLPLREAVVLYCKTRGKKHDEIVAQLEERARAVIAPRGSDPVRDNKAAFGVFVEKFHPRIGKFNRSLLGGDGGASCEFAGVRLLGAPHFVAAGPDGENRYVYLLASRWEEDDLKAYLSRLIMMKCELWCGENVPGLNDMRGMQIDLVRVSFRNGAQALNHRKNFQRALIEALRGLGMKA